MTEENKDFQASESDMEQDSDTGFGSEGSSEDEFPEAPENKGLKRSLSESEIGADLKRGKKLRKLKKENELKKLHKPPTADELNRLRETENLFHSNLFRLQIDEMLKEVEIKQKRRVEFDSWYEKFSDWVLKVEDGETKYDLSDQNWLKKFKIKVPVAQVPYFVKGSYQFKKPSSVSIIGSYSMGLSYGPKFVIDVLVEMPDSFFQKEDYLNCRYHRKRALYMCELIHHIQLLPGLVEEVRFVAEETNDLKPNVEIIPCGKLSKYVTIELHFALAQGTYKLNRFSPCKNNVRRKWYFKENNEEIENIPTPFYNSTICADLTLQNNMKFMKETLSLHKNIKDGIILIKIWLKQRELHEGISGFNGFCVTMLVCYLLKIKKLNILMSSYQIFRNVCHYLSGCDWTTNGITLCNSTEDSNLPTMSTYHENYQVVFVDVSGYYNLCFAMSPYLFKSIRHEAKLAFDWLNDPSINSFQALFMTKVPFFLHFDHMVIFRDGESLENIADVYCSKEAQLNHCGVISPLVRESIISLLIRGFGKRVTRMLAKLPPKNRWKIDRKHKKSLTLIIGLNLDPNHYYSIVDKALESEAESFREFWGARSELRRFQDGSITEAVVWKARTLSAKRLICKEILSYLLEVKFSLKESDFKYVANQLEEYVAKDVEELSLKVFESYDQLMKELRGLDDLPLDIISVQGTSPVFRYTDAFPPIPQKQRLSLTQNKKVTRNYALIKTELDSCPPWVSPLDVTLQMSTSNKWPHDLEAIRRLRAAFNIKIAESLNSHHGLICKALQDKIEVVKNGFVFRLFIAYQNEIVLLKESTDTDGMVKYKDTEKSLALEKETVHLTKMSSALHGLYQEFNSFGPACCLIKRWISSHLIDEYFMSAISIELLVASLYIKSEPHEPPQQPQVAFLRFLKLISTTNWNTDCIVLNFNKELSRSEIIEIESYFTTNRTVLPPIFIATPYDRNKSIWTKDSPNSLILLRLIELCTTALCIIESSIYSETLFDIKTLTKPCLDPFDVILTLNDNFNPKRKAIYHKTVNFFKEDIQKIPINGFDPVSLYLKELRENYGDFALFFHDSYGGSLIVVIWKPSVLEPCDFKLTNIAGRKYNSKTKKLEFNKDVILEDFLAIGKELIVQMEVKVNGVFKKYNVTE